MFTEIYFKYFEDKVLKEYEQLKRLFQRKEISFVPQQDYHHTTIVACRTWRIHYLAFSYFRALYFIIFIYFSFKLTT